MPLELSVWRVDEGLEPVEFGPLDVESRLEDMLDESIGIASPNWMVIGRQVRTAHDKLIDLLAIDRDGNLVVLELKRDKTYRDIVAQVLDYGSWVRELQNDDVAKTFDDYLKRYHSERAKESIDDAFRNRFGINPPDELNVAHELVIVAASLDDSTERVVKYLAEEYDVKINAVFFRVFRDGDREYLSRAWLSDPTAASSGSREQGATGEWNGEYYVSFGYPIPIVEAGLKYGFIAAGGGEWYSKTLSLLEPGGRIWVNIPTQGYIGVGTVAGEPIPVDDFTVEDDSDREVNVTEVCPDAASLPRYADDPDSADYFVRVDWIKTVKPGQAIREKGFFGNQNSVARPKSPRWEHTVQRLKVRFGVE